MYVPYVNDLHLVCFISTTANAFVHSVELCYFATMYSVRICVWVFLHDVLVLLYSNDPFTSTAKVSIDGEPPVYARASFILYGVASYHPVFQQIFSSLSWFGPTSTKQVRSNSRGVVHSEIARTPRTAFYSQSITDFMAVAKRPMAVIATKLRWVRVAQNVHTEMKHGIVSSRDRRHSWRSPSNVDHLVTERYSES